MERITEMIAQTTVEGILLILFAALVLSIGETYYHESINKAIFAEYGINSTIYIYFGVPSQTIQSAQDYWNASNPNDTFLGSLGRSLSFMPWIGGVTIPNYSQLSKLNTAQYSSLRAALESNENYKNQDRQELMLTYIPLTISFVVIFIMQRGHIKW